MLSVSSCCVLFCCCRPIALLFCLSVCVCYNRKAALNFVKRRLISALWWWWWWWWWCCCCCIRVVISALKCFHDLTEKIESGHCGTDGAAEYRRSYIQPVVDQSRDTVTRRCTLAPPYDQDYVSSGAARRPRWSFLSVEAVLPWLATLSSLTVARHWRVVSDSLRTTL